MIPLILGTIGSLIASLTLVGVGLVLAQEYRR